MDKNSHLNHKRFNMLRWDFFLKNLTFKVSVFWDQYISKRNSHFSCMISHNSNCILGWAKLLKERLDFDLKNVRISEYADLIWASTKIVKYFWYLATFKRDLKGNSRFICFNWASYAPMHKFRANVSFTKGYNMPKFHTHFI